ncbi:MAG: tyrosine-type recombinase/integrase [Candidatus Eremiobacteraeota bacterium]|nr:tyrosine-type recombinase/integrase [Candidatus Eremiobacteraeota bacterium]
MSIYKLPSGNWRVVIDVDRETNGSRGRRSLGAFKTRKDAALAEREALTARDRGIDLAPMTVTIRELADRYLSDREALGRGEKTIEEYRRIIALYIVPHLGEKIVAKLRPAHVSEWIANLSRSGGRDSRALAPKTVRHAFALLNGTMRWAVRMQLAGRNVCEAVTPPTASPSEAKALTSDEVRRLLAVAREGRWSSFATLALTLGARRGELCGLSWSDVDLDAGTVTIRRSLSQTKGRVVLKGTKSGKSRTLPLSRHAIDALRRQRAAQAADRLKAGGLYGDDGAVFADELGQRVTPKSATNAFARLAEKAKISTTRLHDLRHTAATTLLVNGVDVRTTAGVLGHSTPNVTLSTYAHLVANAQRSAVDSLGDSIEKLSNG